MYYIAFYVPATHLESVKMALFKKGAGQVGNYTCCSWQTKGEGQFYPQPGSHPFAGTTEQLECVEEYKVEMICEETYIQDVVAALKAAHPYEEPAYQVIKLSEF